MIKIYFTQCTKSFKEDDFCREALFMPVRLRCEFYEEILRGYAGVGHTKVFRTLDEHLLLIAQ